MSADHRRRARTMIKAGVVPAFVTPFALALTGSRRQRRRARRRGAVRGGSAEGNGGEKLEEGPRQRARGMLLVPTVGGRISAKAGDATNGRGLVSVKAVTLSF